MTGTILPPSLRPLLPRAEWRWPDDHDARRALAARLCAAGAEARRALYTWAHEHARPDDGRAPTLAQWGAVVGVTEGAMRQRRAVDAELKALPIRRAGGEPRPDASPEALRMRELRERKRAGLPLRKPGRKPRKTPT